jgi:hypothetical protein
VPLDSVSGDWLALVSDGVLVLSLDLAWVSKSVSESGD